MCLLSQNTTYIRYIFKYKIHAYRQTDTHSLQPNLKNPKSTIVAFRTITDTEEFHHTCTATTCSPAVIYSVAFNIKTLTIGQMYTSASPAPPINVIKSFSNM